MIPENYKRWKEEIAHTARACGRNPEEITLVAISKGQNWNDVEPIYQEGCRNFGENRLQEALTKIQAAPQDCRWHFVGTLQKNKVRKAIGHFTLIHSVDSLELAKKISEVSLEQQIKTCILLQVNTSGEKSKQGMSSEECFMYFDQITSLPGIDVQGLMTMAPYVEDEKIIRQTFSSLRILKDRLVAEYQLIKGLPHLSMGMSHDFKLAIAEGATLLRIGSRIWH